MLCIVIHVNAFISSLSRAADIQFAQLACRVPSPSHLHRIYTLLAIAVKLIRGQSLVDQPDHYHEQHDDDDAMGSEQHCHIFDLVHSFAKNCVTHKLRVTDPHLMACTSPIESASTDVGQQDTFLNLDDMVDVSDLHLRFISVRKTAVRNLAVDICVNLVKTLCTLCSYPCKQLPSNVVANLTALLSAFLTSLLSNMERNFYQVQEVPSECKVVWCDHIMSEMQQRIFQKQTPPCDPHRRNDLPVSPDTPSQASPASIVPPPEDPSPSNRPALQRPPKQGDAHLRRNAKAPSSPSYKASARAKKEQLVSIPQTCNIKRSIPLCLPLRGPFKKEDQPDEKQDDSQNKVPSGTPDTTSAPAVVRSPPRIPKRASQLERSTAPMRKQGKSAKTAQPPKTTCEPRFGADPATSTVRLSKPRFILKRNVKRLLPPARQTVPCVEDGTDDGCGKADGDHDDDDQPLGRWRTAKMPHPTSSLCANPAPKVKVKPPALKEVTEASDPLLYIPKKRSMDMRNPRSKEGQGRVRRQGKKASKMDKGVTEGDATGGPTIFFLEKLNSAVITAAVAQRETEVEVVVLDSDSETDNGNNEVAGNKVVDIGSATENKVDALRRNMVVPVDVVNDESPTVNDAVCKGLVGEKNIGNLANRQDVNECNGLGKHAGLANYGDKDGKVAPHTEDTSRNNGNVIENTGGVSDITGQITDVSHVRAEPGLRSDWESTLDSNITGELLFQDEKVPDKRKANHDADSAGSRMTVEMPNSQRPAEDMATVQELEAPDRVGETAGLLMVDIICGKEDTNGKENESVETQQESELRAWLVRLEAREQDVHEQEVCIEEAGVKVLKDEIDVLVSKMELKKRELEVKEVVSKRKRQSLEDLKQIKRRRN